MTTKSTKEVVISPYGGKLVDLVATGDAREALLKEAATLPYIQISDRAVHDLELLATGGFSPLEGFMNEAEYRGVMNDLRLADGTLFPLPITLPVDRDELPEDAKKIVLRDSRNNLLAVMDIEEAYKWNWKEEAEKVLGSTDPRHPLVAEMVRWGDTNISGKLQVVNLPTYNDFVEIRRTPAEVRALLNELGHD